MDAGAGVPAAPVGAAEPSPDPPPPPKPPPAVELGIAVLLLLRVVDEENEVREVDDSEVVKEMEVSVVEEELAKKLLTLVLLKGRVVEEELELKEPVREGKVVEFCEEDGARDDKKVVGTGGVELVLVAVPVLVLADEEVGSEEDARLLPGLGTLPAVEAGGGSDSLETVSAGDRVLVVPVASSTSSVTGGENTVETSMGEPLPSTYWMTDTVWMMRVMSESRSLTPPAWRRRRSWSLDGSSSGSGVLGAGWALGWTCWLCWRWWCICMCMCMWASAGSLGWCTSWCECRCLISGAGV